MMETMELQKLRRDYYLKHLNELFKIAKKTRVFSGFTLVYEMATSAIDNEYLTEIRELHKKALKEMN